MTLAPNKSPPLRPYQQDVLDKMTAYDGRAALCVLATGLGKTRIFAEFLRREALDNDHTCLILSHREELVTQPLEYLQGIPCGIEQGNHHADPARHKVISASVQSLVHRLRGYNPYEVQTVNANLKLEENAEQILSFFGGVGVTKIRCFLAQKECSRFAVSGA